MNEVAIDHSPSGGIITACPFLLCVSRLICMRLARPASLFIFLSKFHIGSPREAAVVVGEDVRLDFSSVSLLLFTFFLP